MAKLKICKKCGRIKSFYQFYKNSETSDGYENKCKECRKLKMRRQYKQDDVHKRKSEYQSRWAKNNKEAVNRISKKVRQKVKWEVFTHYGGNPPKCKCCGEKIYRFLQLDHINGGGTKERIKYGAGSPLYGVLRKKKYPKGYQILCANCNYAKRFGICPHKLKNHGKN
jgi:hypothetical protein